MIVDNLSNLKMYYGLNEKFEKAFEFIKKATEENLPIGKYEIVGTEVYGLVQEYTSKTEEQGKFEGHREYIDIQYIISGIERIEVIDISKAKVTTEYDYMKDIEFYDNNERKVNLVLEDGEYAIFYPNDIHKPGMTFGDTPTTVKKIVVKVKISASYQQKS